jgi:hypothetical protein
MHHNPVPQHAFSRHLHNATKAHIHRCGLQSQTQYQNDQSPLSFAPWGWYLTWPLKPLHHDSEDDEVNVGDGDTDSEGEENSNKE